MFKTVASQYKRESHNKRKRQPNLLTSTIALPIQSELNSVLYCYCIRRLAASKTIWYPTFWANKAAIQNRV